MLVLSRRIGEEIVIGGDIRVSVVAMQGNQFRIGITAPKSVPVVREEILVRAAEHVASPRQEELSLSYF